VTAVLPRDGVRPTPEEHTRRAPDLTVLQSFPQLRPTVNPYLAELARVLPDAGVRVRTFGWRTALLGQYDVFHVHWPELLLRGRSRWRTAARQAAALALLLRLRLTGRPLVRTVHNRVPHEAGTGRERLLLRLFRRWTTAEIVLTESVPGQGATGAPAAPAVTVIPHGHYRDWFATVPTARRDAGPVPGRMLFFGLVRPYKGVPRLVDRFRALPDPALSLHVVGRPSDDSIAHAVTESAGSDSRISVSLTHVDDPVLAQEVTEAELVVLPYDEMGNSGAVLLALSLGTPVLVPQHPVTDALADEVGHDWVLRYRGRLDAEDLGDALAAVRTSARRRTRPDLSRRDWPAAGRQHAQAYRSAVSGTSRTGRPTKRTAQRSSN
jgi:beta-1,4-mannosyltransferase